MSRIRSFFSKLNNQMLAAFFLSMIFLLVSCFLFFYRRTFSLLQQDSQALQSQSIHQSQRWVGRTFSETAAAVSLIVYGSNGQTVLSHTPDTRISEDVLLYQDFIHEIERVLSHYSSIYSIYLYTDEGAQVGTSRMHSCLNLQPDSFPEIRRTVGEASGSAWTIIGGLKEDFFNSQFILGEDDPQLVTMVKRINSTTGSSQHGYAVVNIIENDVFDEYRTESPNDEILLLNNSSQILSGADKREIGKSYRYQQHLDLSRGDFSSTTVENHVSMLNMSARVSGTNLWLVERIPLLDLETTSRNIIWTTVLTMSAGCMLMLFAVSVWMRRKLSPLNSLVDKMKDVRKGKFGSTLDRIPNDEIGILVRNFNEMSISIRTLMEKNEEANHEKTEQELIALQSQLNPHFIYNTLNMIKWMAVMERADNIAECITTLGCLLEPIFKNKGRFWLVRDEMNYLQNYIRIMGWRYSSACTFECRVPDDCSGLMIPRFILQPIVENSVTHGIPKEKAICIAISAEKKKGKLLLRVDDNGSSIPPDKLAKIRAALSCGDEKPASGIGLFNVNRRIRLNFGLEYGLQVESALDHGTSVVITLPAELPGPGSTGVLNPTGF